MTELCSVIVQNPFPERFKRHSLRTVKQLLDQPCMRAHQRSYSDRTLFRDPLRLRSIIRKLCRVLTKSQRKSNKLPCEDSKHDERIQLIALEGSRERVAFHLFPLPDEQQEDAF